MIREQERELEGEGGALKHYNGNESQRSEGCIVCDREPVSKGASGL